MRVFDNYTRWKFDEFRDPNNPIGDLVDEYGTFENELHFLGIVALED